MNFKDKLKLNAKKSSDGSSDFRRKILQHRFAVIYRTVIIIVAGGILAVAFYIQMKNRVYESYEVTSSVRKEDVSGTTWTYLGQNILTYSSDGASCMDKKGDLLWNQTFQMQNPIVDNTGITVAIGDYNGRNIYVMNTNGPVCKIDTKMPLRAFSVADNGIVAAVLDDSNITWIYLFDTKGETIAYVKSTMKQSGYPVDISISDDGIVLGVSYLYVDNGTMKSTVAFYNFGPVGQNEVDNFVSSYDYIDQVMAYIDFYGSGKAVAVGDSRMSMYEGNQKPVSKADILISDEIKGVYTGKNNVALVYNDTSGTAENKIVIYDEEGQIADTIFSDIQFKDILFIKDEIIIYNERECLIHVIGGADKYVGDFGTTVYNMIPTERDHEYILVTPTSIDTVRLL